MTAPAPPRATTKGATRVADVPPDVLADLHAGTRATRTLAETLALDFAALLGAAFPALAGAARAGIDPAAGVTRRMAQAAAVLRAGLGADAFAATAGHPSDVVRGWACYVACAEAGPGLPDLLAALRPLADDGHFAVREWVWLALRPHVAADVPLALAELAPWTAETSANLRRFASEATRPRGVWCAHLGPLRRDPAPGLPLLEPLRADPSRYVQDSVANWLNDAAKEHPGWVTDLCTRWSADSPGPYTAYIVKRACRSLPK
ncbi:DNA alkylation repair protein [Novispirillum sp. DQ9]|uniref:DNA alkylation repair protein n=1 Tax=Novispirillum sp. DQ9 TaxID=3398612 RepID=UPI003C7B3073